MILLCPLSAVSLSSTLLRGEREKEGLWLPAYGVSLLGPRQARRMVLGGWPRQDKALGPGLPKTSQLWVAKGCQAPWKQAMKRKPFLPACLPPSTGLLSTFHRASSPPIFRRKNPTTTNKPPPPASTRCSWNPGNNSPHLASPAFTHGDSRTHKLGPGSGTPG